MVGGRPNGGFQGWDPGPPWRFILLFIMVALSRVAQRPLDPLISSSLFATTSMLLLSGGTHIGGGGHHFFGTSSCAASSLSLCDYLSHGFATPEMSPFFCGSAPHTPEDGWPTPLYGSHVPHVASLSPLGPEPFTSATFTHPLLAKHLLPDFVDAIPISAYVLVGKVSIVSLGPESFTSATINHPFLSKDLQPDFVDAIPTSVYVTAGKVPIEMPGSFVIKDLTHLAATAAAADPDLDSYDLFHATHPDFGQGVQARTWRANRQD